MDRLIVHNDRIIPLDDAHLSPGQAGLLMGWGVFTTLRLYRGQPFEFHRHWERLTRDAASLSVPMVDAEEIVERCIVELARANGREEGMARLTFIRNAGGTWAAAAGRRATDLLVFTHELLPDLARIACGFNPGQCFQARSSPAPKCFLGPRTPCCSSEPAPTASTTCCC
jgi:branched-subunit amino acid aminotransferase/4-amino-4-deoxychorismate lyase